MQEPSGQKFAGGHRCGSAGQAQMFARRAVAYFPDESVVIKMKKTRGRHYTGEHTLHRLDFEAGIEIREGTVGKNKPDVQPNQRTASSKNKAHEAADGAVLFHT